MLDGHEHDARDGGPRRIAPGSQRLCAATGEVKGVDDMIRFVLGPDEKLVPDLKRRLPGRGVWVTASRHVLELAVKRGSFARGFRREISPSCDLVELTERLMQQSALDALAIAHKAHKVAIGYGRAEMALAQAKVVGLLVAADAAAASVRRLKAMRTRENGVDLPVIEGFSSVQLDLALGRANVIHAALLAGRESETFLARVARLECFRTGIPMAGRPAGANIGNSDRPQPGVGALNGGCNES
jgi:uncharacterized protein